MTKESTSPKSRSRVILQDVQIERTELGYVTCIYRPTRTFFLQLCKYSNKELLDFNDELHQYCLNKVKTMQEKGLKTKRVHKGEVVAVRFNEDDHWYRALVLNEDKTNKRYFVVFIDYGNVSIVTIDDVIRPDPKDIPIIERSSFGVSCLVKGAESLDDSRSDFLLDCLNQNYIMVKMLSKLSRIQWKVEIPSHGYNNPFWLIYRPDLRPSDRVGYSRLDLDKVEPGVEVDKKSPFSEQAK